MSKLLEQHADPTRVRSDFDHDVCRRPREKRLQILLSRSYRCTLLHLSLRAEHADFALLVSQVASNGLDGRVRHGRSLLWTSSPHSTRRLPAGGEGGRLIPSALASPPHVAPKAR